MSEQDELEDRSKYQRDEDALYESAQKFLWGSFFTPYFSEYGSTVNSFLSLKPVLDAGLLLLGGTVTLVEGIVEIAINIPHLGSEKSDMMQGIRKATIGVTVILAMAISPVISLVSALSRLYATISTKPENSNSAQRGHQPVAQDKNITQTYKKHLSQRAQARRKEPIDEERPSTSKGPSQ